MLGPHLFHSDRAMRCLTSQVDVPWADAKARNCVSGLREHRYLCDTEVVLASLPIDSSLRPRIVCSAGGFLNSCGFGAGLHDTAPWYLSRPAPQCMEFCVRICCQKLAEVSVRHCPLTNAVPDVGSMGIGLVILGHFPV